MKKLYAMGGAMRMAGIAALVALFSLTLGGMPATAEEPRAQPTEQASEMSITSIERTDGWEWTGEAIAEAVGASDALAYEPPTQEFHSRTLPTLPTLFPEETQRSVSFPEWVATNPSIVTHAGEVHPSTVGKLVSHKIVDGELKPWSCTGTVVTSSSGSLIITAGHCAWPREVDEDEDGNGLLVNDMEFIPAYHIDVNGVEQHPYGKWEIASAIAPDCWVVEKLSRCDQAFVKAAPRTSDGKTLQSIVGSLGLTIGGSPVRGVPSDMPKRFPLSMHSYPIAENTFDNSGDPDISRVYRCEGQTSAGDQLFEFLGSIKMPCAEPITGGASGAAFVERQQAGKMIIATFVGRVSSTTSPPLLALLNNSMTKSMHAALNQHVPLPN